MVLAFTACAVTLLGCSSSAASDPGAQDAEASGYPEDASGPGSADSDATDAATPPANDGGASDAIPSIGDAAWPQNDGGETSPATDCTVVRCHYVRSGATGSQDGTDWNNAYPVLPPALTRGDTYFVAGGSYPAYTFDDPESGSDVITIKKSTAWDHGTDNGWQPAYGSAQAIFNSILTFNTGHYVFDGQTRNESDWFDGASYGFQVFHNNTLLQNIMIGVTGNQVATNVTVKHTYINAPYKNLPTSTTIAQLAVSTDTWPVTGVSVHTGLLFTHMYVHGGCNIWFLRNTNGAIVEYSASEGASSTAANHGEIVNLYYTGANAVIRYNQWRNEYIGYGGTALVAITNAHNETANGLSFYGNVAWDFETGDAAVGFGGYASDHNRVYNNTFIRGVGFNSGTAWGSGVDNIAYNNLFIDCKTVRLEGTHDYNGFSDSDGRGEAHAQVGVPTSIFADYSNGKFTLARGTDPGFPLPSPYDQDSLKNPRGADGAWDRGAFEWK